MKFDILKMQKEDHIDFGYGRAGKDTNVEKSDLYFLQKRDFDIIEPTELMTGVFVGYRPTSNNSMFYAPWMMQTCYHSDDDLKHIYKLVKRSADMPDWITYDYFIMNASGKILLKNFDFDTSVDQNGVIRLSSPEHNLKFYVYPAEKRNYSYKTHFCYGDDFDELNQHIKEMVSAKIVQVPKNFKKGFSETSSLGRE